MRSSVLNQISYRTIKIRIERHDSKGIGIVEYTIAVSKKRNVTITVLQNSEHESTGIQAHTGDESADNN